MPRKARIDAPGALHHVIVRRIEGRKILRGDVGAESSLRMNVEIRIWFFPDDVNRFSLEALTPTCLATSAPEYPNSLTPNRNKDPIPFYASSHNAMQYT
jgi:hypothetical protein